MIIGIDWNCGNPVGTVERDYYVLADEIYNSWISRGAPEAGDILTLGDGAILKYQSPGKHRCEYFEFVQSGYNSGRRKISKFLEKTDHSEVGASDVLGSAYWEYIREAT